MTRRRAVQRSGAITALCAVSLVAGCGGSGHKSAGSIADLCSSPCTDGQQDYVDHVALVPNATVGASHTVVAMRLRIKNLSSESVDIEPRLDVELVDSQQKSSTPDNPIVTVADRPTDHPTQCPDLSSVTLVPGDSHTFQLCFGLAGAGDLPRVLRIPGNAEIKLQ